MGVGWQELVLIMIIALLLFGGKKIPELMKGLGTGMREFKKGLSGEDDAPKREVKSDKTDTPGN
ncbi:MAG: twin-arginine translocase TatA/TatE family subunit [bacterium]|nr:twin-arginine translocase TatA/TatE family subunit [bacterium]